MLIRSNRPFQGGGNGETEESRPLKVPERRNGGWKQMVGCQEYLPLSPSLYIFFLLSIFVSYECELTVSSWGTGAWGITVCLGHCQITHAR